MCWSGVASVYRCPHAPSPSLADTTRRCVSCLFTTMVTRHTESRLGHLLVSPLLAAAQITPFLILSALLYRCISGCRLSDASHKGRPEDALSGSQPQLVVALVA
ncbi:hypothetical protein E2C01_084036 [Portunus trituberculatus]|uniref:Uncharacterized protein n=1 Tax=Portunus trituberculatus TaxID=210409 RepID=A0A5B7J9L6_PORTR|nr:hypothetical protein [Portunus trituberculatus]